MEHFSYLQDSVLFVYQRSDGILMTCTRYFFFRSGMSTAGSCVVFLYGVTVVLAATKWTKFYGSASPHNETDEIVIAEIFAESRAICASECVARGCSSMLYVNFGK